MYLELKMMMRCNIMQCVKSKTRRGKIVQKIVNWRPKGQNTKFRCVCRVYRWATLKSQIPSPARSPLVRLPHPETPPPEEEEGILMDPTFRIRRNRWIRTRLRSEINGGLLLDSTAGGTLRHGAQLYWPVSRFSLSVGLSKAPILSPPSNLKIRMAIAPPRPLVVIKIKLLLNSNNVVDWDGLFCKPFLLPFRYFQEFIGWLVIIYFDRLVHEVTCFSILNLLIDCLWNSYKFQLSFCSFLRNSQLGH